MKIPKALDERNKNFLTNDRKLSFKRQSFSEIARSWSAKEKKAYYIEGLPSSVRVNKTTKSDSKVKETENDVFRAIENNFKFLSIACGNKPRLTSITNTLRPEAAGHQFRICASVP